LSFFISVAVSVIIIIISHATVIEAILLPQLGRGQQVQLLLHLLHSATATAP
jgi:hypothetical protein